MFLSFVLFSYFNYDGPSRGLLRYRATIYALVEIKVGRSELLIHYKVDLTATCFYAVDSLLKTVSPIYT